MEDANGHHYVLQADMLDILGDFFAPADIARLVGVNTVRSIELALFHEQPFGEFFCACGRSHLGRYNAEHTGCGRYCLDAQGLDPLFRGFCEFCCKTGILNSQHSCPGATNMNMEVFTLMQPPAHFSIAAMLASPQSTRAVVMVRKSRADTGEIVGTWNRNWQEVAVDAHALATESVRQGVRLPSWALNTGRIRNGMLRGFNNGAGTFLVQLKSEIITDLSDI